MRYIFFTFFLLIVFYSCKTREADNRPNIILISVDDMGWSDLGCYGSEIATPNIDNLAENGLRFRNFYNTSKCFPSRACLMTGVYAQDCGYSKTFKNPITKAITIGELLQKEGYLTYWSGKHHGAENPYTRGFDRYFGLNDGACNHFNPGLKREGEPEPARKRSNRKWGIDEKTIQPYTPEKGFYTTDVFTDYAIEYVKEAEQQQKPFFLYLAITAPHDPLMAWPEDINKYAGKYDVGYDSIRSKRFQKQLDLGVVKNNITLSASTYKYWASLSAEEKEYEAKIMEVYAAMIDRVDQNIGRLLTSLKQIKLDENTLIIFVSDNGASAEMVRLENDDDNAPIGSMARWISLGEDWANVSNTPYRYFKNYSYEGGIKTPAIFYWPEKIKANSFTDYSGHFIDIMATIADITNATYPETFNNEPITPLRGESLLPVMMGENKQRTSPLFWEWQKGRAVLRDNYKLVKHGLENDWELYNLKTDPSEIEDISDAHPEKKKELESLFDSWFSSSEIKSNL